LHNRGNYILQQHYLHTVAFIYSVIHLLFTNTRKTVGTSHTAPPSVEFI